MSGSHTSGKSVFLDTLGKIKVPFVFLCNFRLQYFYDGYDFQCSYLLDLSHSDSSQRLPTLFHKDATYLGITPLQNLQKMRIFR